MTWNEFKAEVDRVLAEEGRLGEIEVWYIDITYPDTKNLEIRFDEIDSRLVISDKS